MSVKIFNKNILTMSYYDIPYLTQDNTNLSYGFQIGELLSMINIRDCEKVIPYLKYIGYQMELWLHWCCTDSTSINYTIAKNILISKWRATQPNPAFDKFIEMAKSSNLICYNKFVNFLCNKDVAKDFTNISSPNKHKYYLDMYTADTIKTFNKNIKVQIVKSTMNTEKTRRTRQYIIENKLKFVVFITCRIKMAQDTIANLADNGITLLYYKDITQDFCFNSFEGILIVELESIWKFTTAKSFKVPDLLVLDEITSIISQFDSTTMMKKFYINITGLENLIRQTNQIFALDADIDIRIIKLFEGVLSDNNETIHVQWNNKLRENVKAYEHATLGELVSHLYECLCEGKKIFIVCSTKTDVQIITQFIQTYIAHITVLTHDADNASDNLQQHIFNDVNHHWSQHDVVIISPTITNGVDFRIEHFDKCFAIINAHSCVARDIKQMIGRVRKIKDNEIHFYCKSNRGKKTVDSDKLEQMFDLRNSYRYYICNTNNIVTDKPLSYCSSMSTSIAMDVTMNISMDTSVSTLTVDEMKKQATLLESVRKDCIHDYVHEVTEEKIFINGKVSVVKKRNWLYYIQLLNERERNLSWNNISKEFKKTLIEQGIVIQMFQSDTTEHQLEMVETGLRESRKLVNRHKEQKYSQMSISDVDKKGNILRFFSIDLTFKQYKSVSSTLYHYFNSKIEEHCTVEELLVFERSNSRGVNYTSYDRLNAVRKLIKFLGYNVSHTCLKDIVSFTTREFCLDEEGYKIINELVACFRVNIKFPVTTMRCVISVLERVWSLWTGSRLACDKLNVQEEVLTGTSIKYYTLEVIKTNKTFDEIYPYFTTTLIADIKNFNYGCVKS